MKTTNDHPTYGKISYNENFWTGKKALTINGDKAYFISKNEIKFDEKKGTIKGNYLTGLTLTLNGEEIVIMSKPKWYEILVALLPFVFILLWGNSYTLCEILPIVGGAIGVALGGVFSLTSLLFIKKTTKIVKKILIGLVIFIVAVVIAYLLAILVMNIMMYSY